MKKSITLFLSVFLFVCNVFSLDFAIRITPKMDFPQDSNYGLGFGAMVNADLDLFNIMTLGLEGGYSDIKVSATDSDLTLLQGGLNMGLYYYPVSRLYLSANASYGLHTLKASTIANPTKGTYYRAFGELGFRFTPNFVLNATGGYESIMLDNSPYLSYPFAGISAKINLSTNKNVSSNNFAIKFEQVSDAYPVYANMYKTVPLGYATITNVSSAEVRDVHVSFRAGKYTAADKECEVLSKMNRYKKIEVPVYADFGPEILRYSENGKINAELVISYRLLGKRMTEVQNIVLDVTHRNSFVWNDPACLSCFIDTGAPEILEVAKYIAGTEITNLKPGMNSPLQYAAAVMEGLRLSGIIYSQDTVTPYKEYVFTDKDDSVQYPLQTLSLMSGDYDDIGILICSCLECVGIGTGFVPLEDDFIVLVDTTIAPDKKSNQFLEDGVISDENTTWLALSMENFSKGFTTARLEAAKKLNKIAKAEDKSFEIVDVHSAWEYYPPVTFSAYSGAFKNPSKADIIAEVNKATSYYINNDVSALIKKFRSNGDTKRLADCYVRAGMYNEALNEYQKLNTIAAYNNMGMVYTTLKNYKAALNMYNKVLAKEPENKNALANIKKIKILTGEE